jgi:large subunit ribosomal protein L10
MEKKKSKAFVAKEKLVAEIQKHLDASKSVIFVDYKGVNVAEVTKLRNKFRKCGVTYKVYKNNLVKIALNNYGVKELDDKLKGTLAVAFSKTDEISAAKAILDEKFEKKMGIVFGLMGKSVLVAKDCEKLAQMPSKEVLIAQLLGLLKLPAQNLVTVVSAVPRNLAVVVNERAKQLTA